MHFRFCPVCGAELVVAWLGDQQRQCCARPRCGHVFWDNPVPVVAAIVEHEKKIVLARNAAWAPGMFGLITGFLERDEEPETAVIREVAEELSLDGEVEAFLGHHNFRIKNQIIMSYHVRARGEIRLNEELVEYLSLPFDQVRYWPMSTGLVLKQFLEDRGYHPEERPLPAAMQAQMDRLNALRTAGPGGDGAA